MQIGIAGVGRMGAAIALRLMEVGHQVTVWNRSADKTAPLAAAGAKVAASPSALASEADVILTILTNAEAQSAVYDGPQGILAGNISGKLVIDMSTVQPAEIVALAAKVRAKGSAFVECPVGGTTGPARQGKLLGLAGGNAADVARARAILDQLCRRVEHVGPVGAGASMKLAINLPLMVAYQALGEAYVLCRHLGARPQMADGAVRRHLRRAQRPQDARAGRCRGTRRRPRRRHGLRHRFDPQGPAHHDRRGQGAGRQPAGHRAHAGRSSTRPPRTAGAIATAPRCPPIGRSECRPSGNAKFQHR